MAKIAWARIICMNRRRWVQYDPRKKRITFFFFINESHHFAWKYEYANYWVWWCRLPTEIYEIPSLSTTHFNDQVSTIWVWVAAQTTLHPSRGDYAVLKQNQVAFFHDRGKTWSEPNKHIFWIYDIIKFWIFAPTYENLSLKSQWIWAMIISHPLIGF